VLIVIFIGLLCGLVGCGCLIVGIFEAQWKALVVGVILITLSLLILVPVFKQAGSRSEPATSFVFY